MPTPMQIIPANPSFGTLLAQHLGQAAGDIGQGYIQGQQNKQKRAGISTLLQQYGITPEQAEVIARSGIDPKDVLQYGEKLFPKQNQDNLEREQRAKNILTTIQESESLLPYVGSTAIPFTSSFNANPEGLNRKGLEMRNKFDTLSADYASFFRDLETKGVLPQGLYEKVIEPRLPNSKLSERENKGRLAGIKQLAERYGNLQNSKATSEKESKQVLKARNPKTGQTLISKDGGKTWEKG